MSLRARIGKYLREKRNFIKAGTLAFGVPFTAATIWIGGDYGGVAWWLFLAVLSLIVSWLWAWGMWLMLENDLRRIADLEKEQADDHS